MPANHELTTPFISMIREHERIIHKAYGVYSGGNEADRKDLFQDIVLQA